MDLFAYYMQWSGQATKRHKVLRQWRVALTKLNKRVKPLYTTLGQETYPEGRCVMSQLDLTHPQETIGNRCRHRHVLRQPFSNCENSPFLDWFVSRPLSFIKNGEKSQETRKGKRDIFLWNIAEVSGMEKPKRAKAEPNLKFVQGLHIIVNSF